MSLSTTSQQIIVEQAAAHLTPASRLYFCRCICRIVFCQHHRTNGLKAAKTVQIMPPSPTSTPAFMHGG